MPDKTIHKINEGIFIVACCTIFLFCGFSLEKDTVSIVACSVIWIAPVAIYIYECFKESPKYLISKGVMYFIAIQISILVLMHFKYDFFSFGWISDYGDIEKFIFCFLAVAYLAMNYWIIKAFIAHNRNKEESNSKTDENEDFVCEELSEDGKLIVDALANYSQLFVDLQNGKQKIDELKIHLPKVLEDNFAFLIPQEELKKIAESNKYFSSFTQFASVVWANTHIKYDEKLLNEIKDSCIAYKDEIKDLFQNSFNAIHDFIKHPDKETCTHLLSNIIDSFKDDSVGFRIDMHLDGKLFAVVKHILKDTGKGTFQTFFNDERFFDKIEFENLNNDFGVYIKDSLKDLASSLDVEINTDIHSDDFNQCEPHGVSLFGLSMDAINIIKNLGDENKNMSIVVEETVKKRLIKTGVTTAGFFLLDAIVPGLGFISGVIFSSLADGISDELKEEEMADIKADIETKSQNLKQKVANIKSYQQQTKSNIEIISKEEDEKFEEIKNNFNQITDNSESIIKIIFLIERDYMLSFISKSKYLKKTDAIVLKKYIPSEKKIMQKEFDYLKGLKKILSSHSYMRKKGIKEDEFVNTNLINKICLMFAINCIIFVKSMALLLYKQVYNTMKNEMIKYKSEIFSYTEKVSEEGEDIERITKELEDLKKDYNTYATT